MNVLYEEFPCTVMVDGKEYEVVTDFREWIKLQELLERTRKFTARTLNMVLNWYEDEQPKDVVQAVRALQDFLIAREMTSEMEEGAEGRGNGYNRRQQKPSFSFSQDAICIYAAFRSVYGIDITSISYMHWWQFLALFYGLPEDTEIKERIYYRSVDLNTISNKEERKRIKKIKKRIALKEPGREKVSDYQIGDMFA